MPGFNGTGPLGAGPMTGGGFGRCGAASGRGIGAGRRFYGGGGRGGRWFQAGPVPAADPVDVSAAAADTDALERITAALTSIEERLARLEKDRD